MKELKEVLEGLFDHDTDTDIDPFQIILNQLPKVYDHGMSWPNKNNERMDIYKKLNNIIDKSNKEIQIKQLADIGKHKYIC